MVFSRRQVTVIIISTMMLVGGSYFLLFDSLPAEVDSDSRSERVSDSELGFDEVGNLSELTPEHMEALRRDIGSNDIATATSLPPIPEPIRADGRTNWAVYWQPMSELEKQVYGSPVGSFSPRRVGIQVGHWQREDAPDELAALRFNSGANVPGYSEADTMYDIGILIQEYLAAVNIDVDLLPVKIPVDYQADAFISLHADGSNDASIRGFKTAISRTDFSGRSGLLKNTLDSVYAEATGLPEDYSVTRRMTGYYAFNWRRYDHAVHPQTPAVILETGFLTNTSDRRLLTESPERVARAIADAVIEFLQRE